MSKKLNYNFSQIEEDGTIIPQKSDDSFGRWDKIPPNIYELGLRPIGPMEFIQQFTPIPDKDKLIKFDTGVVADVMGKVDRFLSKETKDCFKEMQVCHKMGMIIHGAPGTGKTCAARIAMRQLVEKYDAICLDITQASLRYGTIAISMIRSYQDNPIVLFADEMEEDIKRCNDLYLPFLDGNKSVDGTIFIGCTNFIDRIEGRIKFRKSRIKHLVEVVGLPEAVYREYIVSKLPEGTAKALVDKFCFLAIENKLTIDQLKNALIDYRVDKVKIKKAIQDAAMVKDDGTETVEDENDEEEGDDIWGSGGKLGS